MAKWLTADLASPEFLSVLPDRADTVVHLAQSVHYQKFPEYALDVFAVNVASTALLLDWSCRAGVRRFVFASAGGADRAAHAKRPAYYLATKRSGELLAQSYRDHFAVTVLRFFFVYGPGQRSSMLVPRLIECVRAGRPITLAGEYGLRLNPVYVNDAVRAVARATALDRSDVFDIAGPEILTLRALVDVIGLKVGRRAQYVVNPAAQPDDLVGDIGPMTEHLGAPLWSFTSGVDTLIRGAASERSS